MPVVVVEKLELMDLVVVTEVVHLLVNLDHLVALVVREEMAAMDHPVPLVNRDLLDLVVSNPPYIPRSVVQDLDPVVRDHEPHLALSGGEDGLDAIRAVVDGAPAGLAPGGWLLVEHHHDQSALVMQLMRDAGLVEVSAVADLEGTLRFALACKTSSRS